MRITPIVLAVLLSIAGRASAQDESQSPPPGPTAQATPSPYGHPASSLSPLQPQPSLEPQASPVVLGDQVQMATPNRKLLWASSIAFAASYVPAVLVAVTSSNDSDRYLFIPIAGPWIDLAARSCTSLAAVQCPNATWNGIGLFVDGLFQLAGAIGTGLAFKIPESRTIPVRPAALPNGGFGVVVTLLSPDRRGVEKW
jgi:hypothetical protein